MSERKSMFNRRRYGKCRAHTPELEVRVRGVKVPRGNVYVIACPTGIARKVGMAGNVRVRLAALQASTPHKLILAGQRKFATREMASQVESRAHQLLASQRVSGEWFSASVEECLAAIDEAARHVRYRRGELAYRPHIRHARSLDFAR